MDEKKDDRRGHTVGRKKGEKQRGEVRAESEGRRDEDETKEEVGRKEKRGGEENKPTSHRDREDL